MRGEQHPVPKTRVGNGLPALADMGQLPPLLIQEPPQPPGAWRPRKVWSTFQRVFLAGTAPAFFGAAALGILYALLFPEGMRVPEIRLRAFCQNNLKQMGVVYKMWANEHEGNLPPLAPVLGDFCAETDTIFPEYLTDLTALECPSVRQREAGSGSVTGRVTDNDYFYLGYMIFNEAEARAFIEAYKTRAAEGRGFEEDLMVAPGSGTGGSDRIARLHSDPASAFAKAAGVTVPDASEVPIMFDRASTHHVPGGINVLYLDGHVAFVRLESEFPAQQWFLDALAELER